MGIVCRHRCFHCSFILERTTCKTFSDHRQGACHAWQGKPGFMENSGLGAAQLKQSLECQMPVDIGGPLLSLLLVPAPGNSMWLLLLSLIFMFSIDHKLERLNHNPESQEPGFDRIETWYISPTLWFFAWNMSPLWDLGYSYIISFHWCPSLSIISKKLIGFLSPVNWKSMFS